MERSGQTSKKTVALAVVVLAVVMAIGVAVWYKMYREVPEPAWVHMGQRNAFLYGSVGAEETAGIPYWIFLVLPRVFPEYMPEGGYAGLGIPWEESKEMPAGLTKKTVGYVRVAGNCALCHASQGASADVTPPVVAAGPGSTAAVQRLLYFFKQCAKDPGFTANDIMGEISSWTRMSLVDRLIYRYVLIPRTRERLLRGDSVILDSALWRHSQNPGAGDFRKRLQALEPELQGPEKSVLVEYLKTMQ